MAYVLQSEKSVCHHHIYLSRYHHAEIIRERGKEEIVALNGTSDRSRLELTKERNKYNNQNKMVKVNETKEKGGTFNRFLFSYARYPHSACLLSYSHHVQILSSFIFPFHPTPVCEVRVYVRVGTHAPSPRVDAS